MSEQSFFDPQTNFELSHDQRIAWLRLIRSDNVGPMTFRTLINRYGGAEEALEELPTLAQRGGRKITIASIESAERELETLDHHNARIVAPCEEHYPSYLKFIDAMPPLLTIFGKPETLKAKCVAIVGSRNASASGRRLTREIAGALGEAGYTVASGLARGIDAAAHEASLITGTVAVLAGGISRIYPPENIPLFEHIIETGAAITEMPPQWVATARDFPRRNRIVSGISLATVVIEAAERSGSLITARVAAEQGREVFAVPGSPLDPRANGTNRLLKDGATMVTSANDILDALQSLPDIHLQQVHYPIKEEDILSYFAEPQQDERQTIVSALGPSPVSIDTLIRETGVDASQVHSVLLELELAGKLERQGGQRVALLD